MEPAAKRRKGRWEEGAGGGEEGGRMVTAELVVYDKHSRCLLTEVSEKLVCTGNEIINNAISG